MNDQTPVLAYAEPKEVSQPLVENPPFSIQFEGQFKSLTPFTWDNIPKFAVITGINGTGKSQLLDLLYETLMIRPRREDVKFVGREFGRHEVTYLKGEWKLHSTGPLLFGNIHSMRDGMYQSFLNEQHRINIANSQFRLSEAFQEVIRKFAKQPDQITVDEFYQIFPEVIVENEYELSTKISEIFVKHRLDEINLLAKRELSEAEIREKLGRKPWEVLREIIESAKLPFNINDPSTDDFYSSFHLKLTDKISNAEIEFNSLSSGEMVLMSLVFYLYNSQEKGVYPKLFLLDEPDAHLHPSMSQQFINVMKKVLVDDMGVQVIMTTHSPSTVALAPEDAIFVASRVGDRIQKSSKDAALKLLTSGVPSFSVSYENRRQVFVESKYDVYFYEKIYRKILSTLLPEVSLTFISSGESKTDKHGNPISSCDQVVNITNVLRGSGNKFVWGIVDWDASNEEAEFVKVLGQGNRYSIENYLLDPILITALLFREKLVTREELGLPAHTLYSDLNRFDCTQLQAIADYTVDKVRSEIKPTSEESIEVLLLNNLKISLPLWYLHHQGHDLENKILNAFPSLNKIKAGKEEALKNAIINKVIDDLPELISRDFLDLFTKLQEV